MEYVAKLFDFLYPFRGEIDVHTSEKVVDFFNQVNLLYGTLTKFCTPENCPTMTAGPNASCDNKHRSGRSRYWFLTEDDGSDSLAVQLVDEKHWEDLFIIIVLERCRGIELQSFWVCVHAIFGHDTQANLEMSFGCSQTMTLGRD
ncbi:hypothetical protein V6Z11_D07G242800 [Gossypium hirsutum]